MEPVCNNIDRKCYIIEQPEMNTISLNNDICKSCYMPTACPQSGNYPYQWIFNLPDPYGAQLELEYIYDN